MTFFDSSSTSSIVGLVFICIIGFLFSLMILGCIIVRCNVSCMKNIFWPSSRAQDALSQSVQRKRLRVAAHRGGSINHAENSIGAFEYCIKNGVGLLEMDLCESKDGIPVVAHDHDLERVIDPEWMKRHPECKTVSDCEAKDPSLLPPYADSIRLHFPSPTVSHYSRKLTKFDNGEAEDQAATVATAAAAATVESKTTSSQFPPSALHRLCTLQEVLDFAPRNVALHIDIKQPSKSLVKATVDLIASHPRSGPTVVLGAGGQQNYVDLQRRLGRSRGFRCCPKEKTADDWYEASEYCDEFTCGGYCVCCCCCCSQIPPRSPVTSPASPSSIVEPSSASSRNNNNHEAMSLLLEPNRRPLVFASFMQVVMVYIFHIFGILPYVPLSFDVFSIPCPTTSMKALFARFLPSCLQCLVNVLESPALWSYLRSRGIVIFGWVLNSEKDFEEAILFPLDGIMTDDVPLLNAFYDEKAPDAFVV